MLNLCSVLTILWSIYQVHGVITFCTRTGKNPTQKTEFNYLILGDLLVETDGKNGEEKFYIFKSTADEDKIRQQIDPVCPDEMWFDYGSYTIPLLQATDYLTLLVMDSASYQPPVSNSVAVINEGSLTDRNVITKNGGLGGDYIEVNPLLQKRNVSATSVLPLETGGGVKDEQLQPQDEKVSEEVVYPDIIVTQTKSEPTATDIPPIQITYRGVVTLWNEKTRGSVIVLDSELKKQIATVDNRKLTFKVNDYLMVRSKRRLAFKADPERQEKPATISNVVRMG